MTPKLRLLLYLIPLFTSGSLFAAENEPLTLADAVAKALRKNPAMAVFDAGNRIAEADLITALTRPNPTLQTEVEDALGTGNFTGFQSAIYNVGISQLIETGGKRRLRGEVAKAGQSVQALQYEAARRDLIVETSQRFVMVLALQSVEENSQETLRIANQAYLAIKKQIEAGRGNAVDSGQALLGKNEASLAYANAKRETSLARQQLSGMWAETNPDFSRVEGQLKKPAKAAPSPESFYGSIASHPAMELAKSGVRVAETTLRLEERNKNPNVTVGLGYRRDGELDDNALVLGFSMPLPLFNKNQGGIARANAEIEKREAMVLQARTELELQIGQALARIAAAEMEYNLVSGEMLEAAEDHHSTVSEGFALGRIKYLDLLQAQRSLNTVRKQKIDALAKYHTARVVLESLTGEEF